MDKNKQNIAALRNAVKSRVKAEEAGPPQDEKLDEISLEKIKECYELNEVGDGRLFTLLNKNELLYNKQNSRWYLWRKNYWEIDKLDESYVAVESVVAKYLEFYKNQVEYFESEVVGLKNDGLIKAWQKKLGKIKGRIDKLRSESGIDKCLNMSHKNKISIGIKGDEFDKEPLLFACANGVMDFNTGIFRKGLRKDFITKNSTVKFENINDKAPAWEKFLLEIFSGDKELIKAIQKLIGYAATGLSIEHIMVVFSGSGRNGKTLLMEIISYCLGDMSGPIPAAMLLEQPSNNAAAADAATMLLRGLRVAIASETDEGKKFSPARVKWLTGGDEITCRGLYDRDYVKFLPYFILFLLTNHKPHTSLSDDFAFWERMFLVEFLNNYVDREPENEKEFRRDPELKKKLMSEASGILAWIFRGTQLYLKEGLSWPKAVRDATAIYRKNENHLAEFVEDGISKGDESDREYRVKANALYNHYCDYIDHNEGKAAWRMSSRKFGELMGKKFTRIKSGCAIYLGIKCKDFTLMESEILGKL